MGWWLFNSRFSLDPQKLCPLISFCSTSIWWKWFCFYLQWIEHPTPHSYLHWLQRKWTEHYGLAPQVMWPLVGLRVRSLAHVFYCLFEARVDTAYTGEVSLCKKTPGIVLRVGDTPLMHVHYAHSRLHLNSCSVLSLSLQPWAPYAASHSPIELVLLGAAIYWIFWPLFPWTPRLTVPP